MAASLLEAEILQRLYVDGHPGGQVSRLGANADNITRLWPEMVVIVVVAVLLQLRQLMLNPIHHRLGPRG